MHPNDMKSMFNFSYEKPSAEIVAKAKAKIESLEAKTEERKLRCKKIKDDYGITDTVLIDILNQARAQAKSSYGGASTYSVSNTKTGSTMTEESITVPAGVINNLLSEQDFISAEEAFANSLKLIVRNLKDLIDPNGRERGHRLTAQELEVLGF